uniref:Uncharacterized protein n=1 Tax=Globodera rostochiensis TaxID=31243 RepID=A0A914GVT0_GLORO
MPILTESTNENTTAEQVKNNNNLEHSRQKMKMDELLESIEEHQKLADANETLQHKVVKLEKTQKKQQRNIDNLHKSIAALTVGQQQKNGPILPPPNSRSERAARHRGLSLSGRISLLAIPKGQHGTLASGSSDEPSRTHKFNRSYTPYTGPFKYVDTMKMTDRVFVNYQQKMLSAKNEASNKAPPNGE